MVEKERILEDRLDKMVDKMARHSGEDSNNRRITHGLHILQDMLKTQSTDTNGKKNKDGTGQTRSLKVGKQI